MPQDTLKLVNQHGETIATMQIDMDKEFGSVDMSPERLNAVFPQAQKQIEDAFKDAALKIKKGDDLARINELLSEAVSTAQVVPVMLTVTTETITEELHRILRPLAEDLVRQLLADQDVTTYFRGLVAGVQGSMAQQLKQKLDES